jgi:hypothetical protein
MMLIRAAGVIEIWCQADLLPPADVESFKLAGNAVQFHSRGHGAGSSTGKYLRLRHVLVTSRSINCNKPKGTLHHFGGPLSYPVQVLTA